MSATEAPARTLTEARDRIDAIDDALLDLLHRRADVVADVGRLKRESTDSAAPLNAFRPAREIQMLHRLRAATTPPLAFSTVAAVWREIVSGFTAAQMPLHVAATGEDARGLAREAFGAHAHISVVENAQAVRAAMADTPGTLGIVPAGAGSFATEGGGPRVVAAVPFTGRTIRGYVLSNIPPEPSGDDATLALVDGRLLTVAGAHADDPAGRAALMQTLAQAPESLHILGHYPRPLEE